MCCCAPFVGHIPPMSLQNPKFPSKLNRTEMADEAELFCTSASKTVVFARLLVSVNDLHRGLSSSVFRVEQITQNPPLATAYRFESGHRHQEQRTCAAGSLLFSLNGQKKIRILKLWSFGRGSTGVRLSSAIPLLHLRRSDKQHCIPRKIYNAVRASLSSPFRPQSK